MHDLRAQYMKLWIASSVILLAMFFTSVALAQQFSPLQSDLQDEILNMGQEAALTGLGESGIATLDLRVYVLNIVRDALSVIGIIFVALVIYGGFQYMTSGGNEEKTEKSKQILMRAAIGAFIILSSYGITTFVSRRITRAIFETGLTQAQNCATENGQEACCNEWNELQNNIFERSEDAQSSRELFDRWDECMDRTNASIWGG